MNRSREYSGAPAAKRARSETEATADDCCKLEQRIEAQDAEISRLRAKAEEFDKIIRERVTKTRKNLVKQLQKDLEDQIKLRNSEYQFRVRNQPPGFDKEVYRQTVVSEQIQAITRPHLCSRFIIQS